MQPELTPTQSAMVEQVLQAAVLHEVGRARVRALMRDPSIDSAVIMRSISYASEHEETLRTLVCDLVRKAIP